MRARMLSIAWLALVVAAGCAPGPTSRRYIGHGDRYLKKGDYIRAQGKYVSSFRIKPSGEAAFKSAYCLDKLGHRAESIEALSRAAGLGHDQARIVLASYGAMSTDDIREYIRTHESDPYAWAALGERHFQVGDHELAAEAYETALQLTGDADLGQTVAYNLAVAYLKLGRYPEANRAFEAYAARSGTPLTDKELMLQGAIKYAVGDRATAAKAWSKLPARTRKAIGKAVGDEAEEFASLAIK